MRIASWTCLVVLLWSAAAIAQTAPPPSVPFASFRAQDRSAPSSAVFEFSAARATSDDPVIIKVANRPMHAGDREHRVRLQKRWLAINVPEAYDGIGRFNVECELKRKGEYAACDLYQFKDPKTGLEHDYYIYIGNWPH
jgi:hypothetical protein